MIEAAREAEAHFVFSSLHLSERPIVSRFTPRLRMAAGNLNMEIKRVGKREYAKKPVSNRLAVTTGVPIVTMTKAAVFNSSGIRFNDEGLASGLR